MMTRTEIAMKISDSLIDSLRGGSSKAWVETLDLDDNDDSNEVEIDEVVAEAMEIVAIWLESGRRSGPK